MGYIYKIVNLKNGKYYLGSTTNFNKRVVRHLRDLRNNKHHSIYLQRAFNKHGEECFVFEIIEEIENVVVREQELLDESNFNNMYNVSRSASGGDLISDHPNRDEIIEKLTTQLLNCSKPQPRYGDKNPNWRGGKTFCKCGARIDSKSKVCAKCYDKSGDKNPFFGKKHTKETKKILSEKRLGKYNGNQEKIILVDDKEYKSLSECARDLNVWVGTIANRLKSNNFPEYKYK